MFSNQFGGETVNYSCVILGDINIDYVSDLSNISLQNMNNACINSSILSYVGGNGTFFAEAALEAGFDKIKLICSLGRDVAAETVKSYFNNKEAIELINFPSGEDTGKVLILYQPDDKRILIADRGTNREIFTSFSCKTKDFVYVPADLLYISGYSLFNETSSVTLNSIIQEYKSNGTFCIIDAVPHEIFHSFNWNDYVYNCRGIDGIIIELATILGFMGQERVQESTDEIVEFLLNSFKFCIVRLNAESDFLIADRAKRRIIRIYYKPRIASLRFTDRVVAQIVLRYIDNETDIFTDSEWIDKINEIIGGYDEKHNTAK